MQTSWSHMSKFLIVPNSPPPPLRLEHSILSLSSPSVHIHTHANPRAARPCSRRFISPAPCRSAVTSMADGGSPDQSQARGHRPADHGRTPPSVPCTYGSPWSLLPWQRHRPAPSVSGHAMWARPAIWQRPSSAAAACQASLAPAATDKAAGLSQASLALSDRAWSASSPGLCLVICVRERAKGQQHAKTWPSCMPLQYVVVKIEYHFFLSISLNPTSI